jgi:hypothetical protein
MISVNVRLTCSALTSSLFPSLEQNKSCPTCLRQPTRLFALTTVMASLRLAVSPELLCSWQNKTGVVKAAGVLLCDHHAAARKLLMNS